MQLNDDCVGTSLSYLNIKALLAYRATSKESLTSCLQPVTLSEYSAFSQIPIYFRSRLGTRCLRGGWYMPVAGTRLHY